jgi:hypothetical protein
MSGTRSGRFSRHALAGVDTDEALSAQALPDKRQSEMQRLVQIDEALLATLNEVFADTTLMTDMRKVRLLVKLRGKVEIAWSQTRDAFLEIGRALNEAEAVLDAAERSSLKRGFRRLFPFSDTVASQFRTIARAVDTGGIPKELLPGSYSTAYQMALLNSEQRRLAEQEGLIRPGVPRHALLEFRRINKAVQPRVRGPAPAKIRADLAALRRTEAKMEKALADIRARIVDLERLSRMGEEAEEQAV